HVLNTDPFQRAMNVLHAGEEVWCWNTQLGQARSVCSTTCRCREMLDAEPPTRLPRKFDRAHIVFQPVAHVAVLSGNLAGDPGAWFPGLDGGTNLLDEVALCLEPIPF